MLGKSQQFRQIHSQNIFLSNLIYIHVKYRLIEKKSMRIQRQLKPRAVGNIFWNQCSLTFLCVENICPFLYICKLLDIQSLFSSEMTLSIITSYKGSNSFFCLKSNSNVFVEKDVFVC